MSWTDERIGLLKKMWKEGKSAADIAKTLGKGVTRNAVIGKAHRMGLSGRPSPIKKPSSAAAPKKEVVTAAPKKITTLTPVKKSAASLAGPKSNAVLSKEAEELKKIEKELPQIGGGVALIDLSERMCKWPIGDPKEADFSFCGRNIRVGTPYCPEHAAAAYQSSSRGRGGAAAVAVVVKDEEEVEDVEVEDDDAEEDDTEE